MMFWCSVTTRIAVLVAIGLGFALTAIISYLLLPYIVEYNVKQKLVLSPNSMTFNGWQRTSIPIYTKFYLFNVTNPEAILSQQERPHLEELGPYTFRESIEKVNISWNHLNGTVSYKQIKRWIFVSEKTNGSLDDEVLHLNVPMISAGHKISREGGDLFLYESLNVMIEDSKSLIFKKNTIRELLFDGYEEILLEAAKQFFPETPYTRFGWFYAKNNTSSDGAFRMFTGEKGINRLGLLDSWNNQKTNDKWFGKRCQRLDGFSAGDFQPPYRTPKPKSIDIFIGDICRSITLDFAQEVEFNGIKCNRYWVSPSLFDYTLPENRCYCEANSCPANGVLNVSTCTMGSPSAISFPHFLYADSSYSNSIDGLSPNPLKHSFFMDFENTLGIPVNIAARLQVNIVLEQNENLDFSRNLTQKPIYFPQFWFSTTAEIGDELVQQLNFLVNGVPYYINLITFLFLLIGSLILISAAVLTYRTKKNIHLNRRQKYKSVELNSTTFTN